MIEKFIEKYMDIKSIFLMGSLGKRGNSASRRESLNACDNVASTNWVHAKSAYDQRK